MIQETLITTVNNAGEPHIAPMGVHVEQPLSIIMPFKPSRTLTNLLETGAAVMNFCDDVRIFAGCLTGRRDWPLLPAENIRGYYLAATLAHAELELVKVEDDETRPKLFCKTLQTVNHRPFQGFNRAQFSVLEAAILVSRLHMLPWEKISRELEFLRIGLEKTAGEKELQAWSWLMEVIDQHKKAEVKV